MKNSMQWVLGLGLGTIASSAFAAEPAFDNHLKSAPMVSPAQIYQTQELTTDFALGFTSKSGEESADAGNKTTLDTTGTDVFAAGIYNVKAIGLRAGLIMNYGSSNSNAESKDVTKTTTDGSLLTLSPTVAMPVGPVVLGTAVDVIQTTEKEKGAKEVARNRTVVRPGVLFAQDNVEAGVTYSTKSNSNEVKVDGVEVAPERVAAQTTVHGRFAVDKTMAFGAIVSNVRESAMDKDTQKDQQRFKATGEFDIASVKVEGDVGYNTAFYKNKENVTLKNMGTIALGAAADYEVSKKAAVGGGLGYEFGSDKNDTTKQKFSKNELSVLVRGDMKF